MTDTDHVVLLDDEGRADRHRPEEQRARYRHRAASRLLLPRHQRRRPGARDTPRARQDDVAGRVEQLLLRPPATRRARAHRRAPPRRVRARASRSPTSSSRSPCSATAPSTRTASSSTRCAPSTPPAPTTSRSSTRSRWSTPSGSIPRDLGTRSTATPWAFSPWLVLQAEQLHLFDADPPAATTRIMIPLADPRGHRRRDRRRAARASATARGGLGGGVRGTRRRRRAARRAGGKRLRPALVAASFDGVRRRPDDDARRSIPVAAAFELLHTAFVVHDDVIDHDTVRRGIPNVGRRVPAARARTRGADAAGAALLGDAAAILAGDLLLHEAFRLVALADVDDATRERLLALLDDAIFVSAAGELADVENSVASRATPSPRRSSTPTFNKTAVYSFRAPLRAGALLAGASTRSARRARRARAGASDSRSSSSTTSSARSARREQAGRDAGGDLRESKRTPLVALARQTAVVVAGQRRARAGAHRPHRGARGAARPRGERGARRACALLIDDTLDDVRERRRDDPALPDRRAARCCATLADARRGAHPVTRDARRTGDRARALRPDGAGCRGRRDRRATRPRSGSPAACSAPRPRPHVRNIYALVRIADEIVDGPAAAAGLIADADARGAGRARGRDPRRDRAGASARTSSCTRSPAPRGSAGSARTSSRPFFASMRTDLRTARHDAASHDDYVYGSAEVVGLMCLQVFVNAGAPHPVTPPPSSSTAPGGSARRSRT